MRKVFFFVIIFVMVIIIIIIFIILLINIYYYYYTLPEKKDCWLFLFIPLLSSLIEKVIQLVSSSEINAFNSITDSGSLINIIII